MAASTEGPRRGGGGGRRGRAVPKGRQLDPVALDEVRRTLGDMPRRRDLLIEHLHLIQDAYGHISAAHLVALADEMRLALAEVYEVATFYAHFDVVKEGEAPPPPVTVRVCDSLTCAHARRARSCWPISPRRSAPRVRVVRAPCMGRCDTGAGRARSGTTFGDRDRRRAVAERRSPSGAHAPGAPGLHRPRRLPRRRRLRAAGSACRGGRPQRARRADRRSSRTRGCAASAAPASRPAASGSSCAPSRSPRLMAVNADEGEPGTFKDRYYLETRPAPVSRRHADRRLGGRGRPTSTSTCATNIPQMPRDPEARDRRSSRRRAWRRHARSICGAAPAPTSAAKNRR